MQTGYFDIEVASGIVRVNWKVENRVLTVSLQARNKDGYYGKYYVLRRNNQLLGLAVNGTYIAEFPATTGDWSFQFNADTQSGTFADMDAPEGVPTEWSYNLTNERSVTIAFYGTLYRASPSAHSWGVEGEQVITVNIGAVPIIFDVSAWKECVAEVWDGSAWKECAAEVWNGTSWGT